MDDTGAIRKKILGLWTQFDNGKITAGEARVHIGFARTILDSLKVDIAAAHLSESHIPVVPLGDRPQKQIRRQ